MKAYNGESVKQILDDIAYEEGIDPSLIHYNVASKNEDGVTINVFTDSDIIEFIKEYIETFFYNIKQTVHVDVHYSDEMYRIFVNAQNNSVVIGKDGNTLQAFTNLIRSATNSHFKKHIKLVMDVNNYKANIYEKIESLVYNIAREVQDTKIDTTLDFLPSDQRRVAHNYLSGMPNIKTVSIGQGQERRLVIKYIENEEN